MDDTGVTSAPWKPPVRETRTPVSDVVVEEIPPACPRCHSTDREKKNGTIVRNISGKTRDGRIFNRVKWTYCTCRNCQQKYKIISRINTVD